MSAVPDKDCWLVVVDTNHYAGNFERPMVAWMTGCSGDCGAGKEIAEKAEEDLAVEAISDLVMSTADDHGTRRPATIWPTPGFFNDGMGGHYQDDTDPKLVEETYLRSVRDYAENHIMRSYEDKEYSKAEADKFIAERPKAGRHPAYKSVAVAFRDRPTDDQFRFMAARAMEYAKGEIDPMDCPKDLVISAVRLIRYEIVKTETTIISFDPKKKT